MSVLSEKDIQSSILKNCGYFGFKLFRNNQGMIGGVKFGVGEGGGDLIGWKPVRITEDMVGDTLAIFASVEVKKPGQKMSALQQKFYKDVQENGGIAICATDIDDLRG